MGHLNFTLNFVLVARHSNFEPAMCAEVEWDPEMAVATKSTLL